jgi:hypothetical protein
MASPNELIRKFKGLLKARGARGLIGLSKIFNAMDFNGNKTMTINEFRKAIKDYKMGNLQD